MARLTGPLAAPFAAVALVLGAAGAVLAASEPASWAPEMAPADQARLYILTFTDEDVVVVAGQVLGTVLKTPFEIDPAVTGKMSLVIEERLTRAQLLGVLEASLARNGAALVRRDGTLHVTPSTIPPPADAAARRMTRAHRGDEMVSAALRYNRPSPQAVSVQSPPKTGDPWKAATVSLAGLVFCLLLAGAVFARATRMSVGQALRWRGPGDARQAVLDRLCRDGLIDPATLSLAKQNASVSGRPIEHVLNGMGVVSDEALVAAYVAVTGLPVWRPEMLPPLLWGGETGLGAEGLTRRGLVPVGVAPNRLTLATSDPLDDAGLAGVALETARNVSIMICAPSDVRRAIAAI